MIVYTSWYPRNYSYYYYEYFRSIYEDLYDYGSAFCAHGSVLQVLVQYSYWYGTAGPWCLLLSRCLLLCVCVFRVFSTLKVPGYREQSGGATGRGRMGTMARGDGRARAWGAGVHTGYIATAYLYIRVCVVVN